MDGLISNLSPYGQINYLVPGAVFVLILDHISGFSLVPDNMLIGLILYYFVGVVISRIGSLVVEPILKRVSFVKYANYDDYVAAFKEDSSLEALLEPSNAYRTICSMCLLVLLAKTYEVVGAQWRFSSQTEGTILVTGLLVLFLFSYRKQVAYITKRVGVHTKQSPKSD